MYIKILHIKTHGSDTTVGIRGLVHAYVFQKFYFLNTTVENKIKIFLIWIMHAWKYKITWIYLICWNWYMLKFRLWSNHIPVSQSFSSNLDLEEKRFSFSRTSVRPLRVSTWDQPGITLFNLNFGSPNFSRLNLNEA